MGFRLTQRSVTLNNVEARFLSEFRVISQTWEARMAKRMKWGLDLYCQRLYCSQQIVLFRDEI